MRFEAAGVDQETTDIINRNILILEEWLTAISLQPKIERHRDVLAQSTYKPLQSQRPRVVIQPVRPRRDLEKENLLAHAKSPVPYPPFILP